MHSPPNPTPPPPPPKKKKKKNTHANTTPLWTTETVVTHFTNTRHRQIKFN